MKKSSVKNGQSHQHKSTTSKSRAAHPAFRVLLHKCKYINGVISVPDKNTEKYDPIKAKEEFLEIYNTHIIREGADRLLDYLLSKSSDFFSAPASQRYHGSFEGGLVQHSLNVYHCLTAYLACDRVRDVYGMDYDTQSIAITALLHDICKINCYKPGFRNVKDEQGVWRQVPSYEYEDRLPYGHGEKSVYIITGFMRITREESFAIRYHMGFSGIEDKRNIGEAFELFPLAFALNVADMEATYFLEGKGLRG